MSRDSNWKPLFGQAGSSQGHLDKQGVKKGDLFLFFGRVRQTVLKGNRLTYVKNAPVIHLIFAYLQVGEIYKNSFPSHIKHHPHAGKNFINNSSNAIYEATEKLSFMENLKGSDCLKFHEDLILSKKGLSKSKWNLPESFKKVNISYHSKASFKEGYFQSAAKGQEFVISDGELLMDWVKNIIKKVRSITVE